MTTVADAVNQREEWNQEIRREKQAAKYPKWPNEAMVKVLFGGSTYLRRPLKPESDWRVLDVGCGFGNNLVPFADMGCECHGVDIHEEMAATTQEVMDQRGFRAQFQEGSNRSLPFPDAYFDLLLSVNTLHYEGSEENILAALQEFKRVLKPGGGVYLSTVAPKHEIYKRAETMGGHRYTIRNFGFRDGQQFFFLDNQRYLEYYCRKVFEDVETGRVTEQLMNLPLDFFIAVLR